MLVLRVEELDVEVQRVRVVAAARQAASLRTVAQIHVVVRESLLGHGGSHLVALGARHLRLRAHSLALEVGVETNVGSHGNGVHLLLTSDGGQLLVQLDI